MTENNRRSDDSRIDLLAKDVAYIREFIEQDRDKFAAHIETSEKYREKVDAMVNMKKAFDDHAINDKWMFSTIIGLLIFILGKLFIMKP